jgi:hypothetical protein
VSDPDCSTLAGISFTIVISTASERMSVVSKLCILAGEYVIRSVERRPAMRKFDGMTSGVAPCFDRGRTRRKEPDDGCI